MCAYCFHFQYCLLLPGMNGQAHIRWAFFPIAFSCSSFSLFRARVSLSFKFFFSSIFVAFLQHLLFSSHSFFSKYLFRVLWMLCSLNSCIPKLVISDMQLLKTIEHSFTLVWVIRPISIDCCCWCRSFSSVWSLLFRRNVPLTRNFKIDHICYRLV